MRATGTQIVCVSGPAASRWPPRIRPGLSRARRRVLLVCNTATPETSAPRDEMPGFAPLRDHFDEVLSWNEAIRPFHPAAWTPRPDDVPLLERHFASCRGLGDDRVELVLGAPDTPRPDRRPHLHRRPPPRLRRRPDELRPHPQQARPAGRHPVRRLLHLDLVAGLTPMLLSEFDAPARAVPTAAFQAMAKAVAQEVPRVPDEAALLLGQHPSALAREEDEPHAEMVRAAARRGHDRVVFAPHPASPSRHAAGLRAEAGRLGVDLTVLETPVRWRRCTRASRPALVVGCASGRAVHGVRPVRPPRRPHRHGAPAGPAYAVPAIRGGPRWCWRRRCCRGRRAARPRPAT
ncbi:hypothetical protein STENM223S_03251 [Streptomyces tendae]